jgi:tetratricopeptide (TPR) repeat protein
MGKIDKAINILNKALRQESDEPTILEHLGDVYLAIKNKKLSRQYYERSLNLLQKIPLRMPDEDKQIQNLKDKLATF